MPSVTLTPTMSSVSGNDRDSSSMTLAGLSLPGATDPQAQIWQTDLNFTAVFGPNFASALRVPAISQFVVGIFRESPFEQEEFEAQIAASRTTPGNDPILNSPLASSSLAPQRLLGVSNSGGGISEAPRDSAASNPEANLLRQTPQTSSTQAALVENGRVDGVLLPNLSTVVDVVHFQGLPFEEMTAPIGKIIRNIKLQSASRQNGLSLAA